MMFYAAILLVLFGLYDFGLYDVGRLCDFVRVRYLRWKVDREIAAMYKALMRDGYLFFPDATPQDKTKRRIH